MYHQLYVKFVLEYLNARFLQDNRIGNGNGKYKNIQLFEAEFGHAAFIEVLGLMKESDYEVSPSSSSTSSSSLKPTCTY